MLVPLPKGREIGLRLLLPAVAKKNSSKPPATCALRLVSFRLSKHVKVKSHENTRGSSQPGDHFVELAFAHFFHDILFCVFFP